MSNSHQNRSSNVKSEQFDDDGSTDNHHHPSAKWNNDPGHAHAQHQQQQQHHDVAFKDTLTDKDGAAGPVKAACLSCRQKKAKCDGTKPICGQCGRKNLECIYIKSKRGGARKKRTGAAPSALQEFLKKLDGLLAVPHFDLHHAEPQDGDDPTNIVRSFASREEVMKCYYNEVHPYLSVMPPRHYLVDVLPELLHESPFLLATQTVLTLIPHQLDPNPRSARSKRLRSAASAQLGKQAAEAVERTLARGQSLEVVQALCILAVWEWGSTNDATAAMRRASQAVQVAMDMGIHDMDRDGTGFALEGIDWHKDAMRRTWWILYVYQLTIALVSGLPPPVGPDDKRVRVDFPICSDKDRTWSTWVNCIRQCSRVCAIVNELIYAPSQTEPATHTWGTLPADALSAQQAADKRRQMIQFDKEIMELMKQTERMSIVEQVPGGEEEVVKNQQIGTRFGLAVTHIHIHRHQAFPEVSLYSKRICGFPASGATDIDDSSEAGSSIHRKDSGDSAVSFDDYGTTQPTEYHPQLQQPSAQGYNYASGYQNQQHHAPQPVAHQQGAASQSPMMAFGSAYYQEAVLRVDQMMANFNNPVRAQQHQQQQQQQQQMAAQPPHHSYSTDSAPHTFNSYQIAPEPHQQHLSSGQLQYSAPPQQPVYASQQQQFASPPQQQYSGSLPTAPLSPDAYMSQSFGGQTTYEPQSYTSGPEYQQTNTFTSPPQTTVVHPEYAQWQHQQQHPQSGITQDMWHPETYPEYLPPPWFAKPNGAAELFIPPLDEPRHVPAIQIPPVIEAYQVPPPSVAPQLSVSPTLDMTNYSSGASSRAATVPAPSAPVKHRTWGIDENDEFVPTEDVKAAELVETFPPGISLARCATAANAIVRLEIVHRSAALALDGTPKWIPFCACGLVSGAYSFLLLVLAVQAENTFGEYSEARSEEVEALLTNVKIILAGLEAYGIMWEGIDMMAREVRAAVEAATRLPTEVQSARSSSNPASGGAISNVPHGYDQ
ncbi:Lysine biosynthesis regulatory protein LYS14 [Vanrija pseudolonga]|uniref:Lysine biosynthesis regulatory protein LYS14 n=1 Tax=Vanrija pseudolonga TaxID=143232 RepID=A0AAF0Y737_9TREE|nr:Lysine biosynthesis regulatory protein LYS14 [Vanrija pseudolonga]